MNKLLRQFLPMAAMMMLEASADKVYTDGEPTTPTKREPRKTKAEELASKGLQEFVINGEKIIARNEREAQKRYKHRKS
ncbi:MAG: hypothetical protein MJZ30_05855 [Paludibacteraceae bacterium]|nr:hypothetical protein [Paludibacteraceae bacterium]